MRSMRDTLAWARHNSRTIHRGLTLTSVHSLVQAQFLSQTGTMISVGSPFRIFGTPNQQSSVTVFHGIWSDLNRADYL